MRHRKSKQVLKVGDLITLRSCTLESDRTQIGSEEDEQVSIWVDNGSSALITRVEGQRITIMCNNFVGWVWRDECVAVSP